MAIQLEQLTHENLPEACAIDRDDIPEAWVDDAETLMEFTDYGAENHLIGHTYIARKVENGQPGKAVGIIMIGEALEWPTDPEEMKGKPFYRVMGFAVDKDHRNKGIGGEILEKAISQVYEEFGRRSLALGVHKDNTRVGAFYERHGFKRMGMYEGNDEYYLRLI